MPCLLCDYRTTGGATGEMMENDDVDRNDDDDNDENHNDDDDNNINDDDGHAFDDTTDIDNETIYSISF